MKVKQSYWYFKQTATQRYPTHRKNDISLMIMVHICAILCMTSSGQGQKNQTSLTQIQILENRALKKITFQKRHNSTNSIYKEFHILKFKDLIYLQICLYMSQIEQKHLAASFPGLKYCGESHNYMTRSIGSQKNWVLHIPTNRTDRYGKESVKYNCILDWNKSKKDFHGVNQDDLSHENSHKRSYS